jgi:hypothetical protein
VTRVVIDEVVHDAEVEERLVDLINRAWHALLHGGSECQANGR